jgi:hypothetical protein
METILSLVRHTSTRTEVRRLDWHLVNRVAQDRHVQELLGHPQGGTRIHAPATRDIGFSIDGFDHLNLDGLVQVLCLSEALSRSGLPPILVMPARSDQQESLAGNGFIRSARNVSRLQGPRFSDWDIADEPKFILGRPYISRFTDAAQLSSIQERLDRFLISPSLLRILGIDPTSEDGWEWAPSLARAVNEILRNILEWSGVDSGFIAMESFPGTLVRLVVADSGVGVEHSLRRQRSPTLGLEALKFALLFRYYHDEKPGLFTVLQTVSRWGGEFFIRSGYSQFNLKLARGGPDPSVLMNRVIQEKTSGVAFLPGFQIRVDFLIPRSFARRR